MTIRPETKIAQYIALVTAAGPAGLALEEACSIIGTTHRAISQMNVRAQEKDVEIRAVRTGKTGTRLYLGEHRPPPLTPPRNRRKTKESLEAARLRRQERDAIKRQAMPPKPMGAPRKTPAKPPKPKKAIRAEKPHKKPPPRPLPFWQAEAIIPDGFTPTICPSGKDFRHTATEAEPFFSTGAVLPVSGWAAAVIASRV